MREAAAGRLPARRHGQRMRQPACGQHLCTKRPATSWVSVVSPSAWRADGRQENTPAAPHQLCCSAPAIAHLRYNILNWRICAHMKQTLLAISIHIHQLLLCGLPTAMLQSKLPR